jgi:hypothetical protein
MNKLQRVDGLVSLTNVETVYLRKNEIASLDGFPATLNNLKHLNLRYVLLKSSTNQLTPSRSNRITNVEEVVKLQHLPNLASLNMIGIIIPATSSYHR